MGIPMEALVRQNYDGRGLKIGEKFSAVSQADADDLVALRFAKMLTAVKPAVAVAAAATVSQGAGPDSSVRDLQATDYKAQQATDYKAQQTPGQHGGRGRYQHRDAKSR
jgi:hypothetical protein